MDRPTHNWNLETIALMEIQPQVMAQDLKRGQFILNLVKAHKELTSTGLTMVPSWVQAKVHEVDPLLRVRYDFEGGNFLLERWAQALDIPSWITVCPLLNGDGDPLRLGVTEMSELCDTLRANDMQRYRTPADYLQAKRERQAAIRARNRKNGANLVMAAVDSLSRDSIANFIRVERAMRSGEKIRVHGADQRFMERAYLNTQKARARGERGPVGGTPLNPGMAPNIYHRDEDQQASYQQRKEELKIQ